MSSAVLVESAVRSLIWMALEHRQPLTFGRNAAPHAERGTKILNEFTVQQTQAMFDFALAVSPPAEGKARPYLADALAYCSVATAAATPGAAPAAPSAKPEAGLYPFVQASRDTPRGRVYVIRLSATQTRVIETGSEEEALQIARRR